MTSPIECRMLLPKTSLSAACGARAKAWPSLLLPLRSHFAARHTQLCIFCWTWLRASRYPWADFTAASVTYAYSRICSRSRVTYWTAVYNNKNTCCSRKLAIAEGQNTFISSSFLDTTPAGFGQFSQSLRQTTHSANRTFVGVSLKPNYIWKP